MEFKDRKDEARSRGMGRGWEGEDNLRASSISRAAGAWTLRQCQEQGSSRLLEALGSEREKEREERYAGP